MRKIESIKELNGICQKPDYKTVGNWMVRRIERPLAIYITWALLHTSVTAHQVTTVAVLTAVVAVISMAQGDPLRFFIGACLLQLWYLLDHVDGQVARYRNTQSIDGLFFDFVMHHIVSFMVLFSVGWAVYMQELDTRWIAIGYVAAVSSAMIGILSDCRSKAVYSYLLQRGRLMLVRTNLPSDNLSMRKNRRSPARRFFSILHKSCEGHVIMNVLTICAAVYLFIGATVPGAPLQLKVTLLYYATAATAVWVSKLINIVAGRSLSREYERIFTDA